MLKKVAAIIGTALAVAAGMFLPALLTFIADTQSAAGYYDMTVLELPEETAETAGTAEAQPEITGEDVIRAFKSCGSFHDTIETRSGSMTLSAQQAAAEAEAFIKMLCDNDAIYLDYPEELSLVRTRCFGYIASAKDAWGETITSIRDIYAPSWVCVFSCYGKMIYVVVDDYLGKVISLATESEEKTAVSPDKRGYAAYTRFLGCVTDYYGEQKIYFSEPDHESHCSDIDWYASYMYSDNSSVRATISTEIDRGDIIFNMDAVPPQSVIDYDDDGAYPEDDAAAYDKTPGAADGEG